MSKLTLEDCRLQISESHLETLANDRHFLAQIVTGDETWVHHWDPETKSE
jgi:hypothetical protein